MAASFEIAARGLGVDESQPSDIVRRVARSYRLAMHEFAAATDLDVW